MSILEKIKSNENVRKEMKNKHQPIRQVVVGDKISSVYILENLFHKLTKAKKTYTDLVVRDNSGNGYIRIWDKVEAKVGSFVKIEATASEYEGNMQIIATDVFVVNQPEDISNYLVKSETKEEDIVKFEEFVNQISVICESINDATCSKILESVFSDDFKNEFYQSPASTQSHYGKNGGLLSHTVKTTQIVRACVKTYKFLLEEKVIAITASLLSKIGMTKSYHFSNFIPEVTKKGKLLGTKSFTLEILNDALSRHEDLNEETVNRIKHALVSIGNEYIKPMTKEALLLSELSLVDQKMTEAVTFIENDQNDHNCFTSYDSYNKTYYYKGESIE